jgi:hypothetical protein
MRNRRRFLAVIASALVLGGCAGSGRSFGLSELMLVYVWLLYLAFWAVVIVVAYKVIRRFFALCNDVAEIKALLQQRNGEAPSEPPGEPALHGE